MAPAANEGGDRMTYEEAIKQLNSIAIYHFDKYTADAINMAIDALEKQIPKSRYTCIKIIIVQFAKKMDGCCGMMLYPTIRTNIVASADRQLTGRRAK